MLKREENGLGSDEEMSDGDGTHHRYLGLDIGTKRIGVAVSDELGLLAQPVMTLERKRNPKDDLRSLARLCRKYQCAGIVAGNPLHLSGDKSAQTERARKFAGELAEMTGLPLHLWDERLTTRQAHAILYEAGKPRQQHGAVVDQVAATLILQGFLDGQAAFGPGVAAPVEDLAERLAEEREL